MSRYTHTVLPVLMGVAAVLLSIAAVGVIVGQLRGGGSGEPDTAATFSQEIGPTMRAPGPQLGARLDQTYLGVRVEVQPSGLLVQSVVANSPAADAGVQVGDVITAVNGAKVDSADALRQELDTIGAGAQYTLTVTRDGKSQDLKVKQATYAGAARDWFEGALNGEGGGWSPYPGVPSPRPSATPSGPQT